MIRRISLALAAFAVLATAACSNPTAPTAPNKVARDGTVDGTVPPSETLTGAPVQGSGI